MTNNGKTDYKSAGVDKEAGYQAVDLIRKLAASTHNPRVLGGIGSFGAFYDLSGYREPVLVSGTDGVGTKLKIAFALNKYDTIGIDAVAMCVNDILCHGAAPQFFLDYLACGKLSPEIAAEIVKGISEGCRQANCALIGGETAEMPGFYQEGEYDIAGFAVGVVEKSELIDGKKVQDGDVLIGLPSSGFHSNGFSLLRKIFPDFSKTYDGKTVGEILLTPTKIYVRDVLAALQKFEINSLAHITGGGLPENLPRAYGDEFCAVIEASTLPKLPLMDEIQKTVDKAECFGTFNMGVGFVMIAAAKDAENIVADFASRGEKAILMGKIKQRTNAEEKILIV
ncbi:MAG: phosphoribosylformylglycinamidine cyclo-ligase [Cardiobacteriaceae bacterium]|nr:phosphoribosylformylglycinamidine cyclo-ligase [Cardiobacteriaceae bacterium]